ncbi:VOC family protein [Lentisalinibacter sediminis]|uniref:VOC family protein n=1 Tax=Lentisalinibacter sediminis TaxID=2992237 RepID=UPI0038666072
MAEHPVNIRLIDHVVIRAKDPDALLAFYEVVLGCPLEKDQAGIGLYQLRAGASLIDIVAVDGELGRNFPQPPADDAPNMDHFCVQVEPWDVDAIRQHLREHGVEAGEVVQRYGAQGYGPSIYIRDPEGNTVELKGPPADAAGG